MTFGERIRKIREENGLSQRELGERMGVKQQTIAQYERAVNIPKLETINKIANALNVMPFELFRNDKEGFSTYSRMRFIEAYYQSKEGQLTKHFECLNDTGQDKAIEQVELLTKIPEYRKDEEPILQAAHEDNPTPEQKAAANRIMQDDSEWE